jgi:hypothetical protein
MAYLEMLLIPNDGSGDILAGGSSDGVHWWHGASEASGFVKTGHKSQAMPSLVAVASRGTNGGNFIMMMLGLGDNNLYVRSSGDGVNWGGNAIGQQSNLSPSLMSGYLPESGNTGLGVAFVAANGSNDLLVCFSGDWIAWSGASQINQTSKLQPAFTGWSDYYVMVFVSNDSSNRLLTCTTTTNAQDQMVWSGANESGQYSKAAPSITGLGSTLWMAFLSNDSSNNILVCSSPDGINWSGATKTGLQSLTAPSITNSGGKLWIAFVAPSNLEACVSSSADGVHWEPYNSVGVQPRWAPVIVGYDFKLNSPLS